MGTGDSVIYGAMITTLLLGAALTYLAVPYAFPGANQWLGILFHRRVGASMMVAYAMLCSAMPRSGGDYVFQSRLVHPVARRALVLWLRALDGALGGPDRVSGRDRRNPHRSARSAHQTGASWLSSFGDLGQPPRGE